MEAPRTSERREDRPLASGEARDTAPLRGEGRQRAIKSAVQEFANDTQGLLHHVYRTPPMLCAAPEESLDFLTAVPEDDDVGRRPVAEETAPALSKTARKRRKAAHDDLRARFQEALKKSREARLAMPKPRPRPGSAMSRPHKMTRSRIGESVMRLRRDRSP